MTTLVKSVPSTHSSSDVTPRHCLRLLNEEPKGPSPHPGTRRSPCCSPTGRAQRRYRLGTPHSPGTPRSQVEPNTERWAKKSVSRAARGGPSSRLPRRAKRSRSPRASRPARRPGCPHLPAWPPAPPHAGGVPTAAESAARAPCLSNPAPRAAARAGTKAFLWRRAMTSRTARGAGAQRAPAGGPGFRGSRGTVRPGGGTSVTLRRVVKGDGPSAELSRALPSQLGLSLSIPKMGQTMPLSGGLERTAPGHS